MGFSTAVLLLSLVHGALGVAVASRAATLARATVSGVGAAAATTLASVIVWRMLVSGFGFFALAHIAYLGVVVTLPLMGVAGWYGRRAATRSYLSGWAGAAVLTALVLPGLVGIYATHIEPRRLEVDRQSLAVDGVRTPVRIGVLADVQTRALSDYEQDALTTLLDEDPDILLLPGDLWQMRSHEMSERWQSFRRYVERMTAAIEHVVIVEGNTDDLAWLERITEGTGAHLLADDSVDLVVNGTPVRVGGLTLTGARIGADHRRTIDSLTAAERGTLRVLVAHRPDVALSNAFAGADVDLLVAGHTHGGQVQLPLIGPIVTYSDVPDDVAAGGLHELNGHPIYVSTGVGMERGDAPQIRFLARPSVGVIDVTGTGRADG